jgi:hypothetical protein
VHSNPSWLERYDAAVLQRVDELGQVREQRSRQCIRLPAALAAKLDDRRLSRRTYREQRSEITIRGHDDSMLGGSALEDHIIVGVLLLLSERGLHHDRPVAGEQKAVAKERCRSGTSFAGGEGQRSFADGFGRKE